MESVKINFWDVAGDPSYYEVRNEFYRDTHGVMQLRLIMAGYSSL